MILEGENIRFCNYKEINPKCQGYLLSIPEQFVNNLFPT